MESWLKPMLCGSADAAVDGDDWQTEPKIDGWRFVTWNTGRGVLSYGGRDGSDYSGQLPGIEMFVRELPSDTALDGELIHPSLGWGGVQSAMTTNTVGSGLYFVVFDVLRVGGVDARANPLRERREVLESLVSLDPDEWVYAVPTISHFDDPLAWSLAHRFEGVVCKHLASPYQSGMRSPFWLKVKPQTTDEAIVTGFKPGKGSFAGLVGAVEFEMLDSEGVRGAKSRASGMTMDVRKHMTEHPDDWLGHVIEIKHHGLSESTGKPRHPQFFRRRDDRAVTPTGNRS